MNWLNYNPPGESQVSNLSDSEGCVSFAAVHCIESQEIKKYGFTKEYSERALAKLSGTTKQGNSVMNVYNTLNTYGLILEKDWPTSPFTTWEEFYADIPPEIIAKGKDFLNQYDIELIVKNPSLQDAPFWTEVQLTNSTHFVEQLNSSQYFDSYLHHVGSFLEDLNVPILNQFQIIIKPKTMSNAVFVQKQGTKEFGFYIPALSPDALKDKAMNLGLNIVNPDGSINFMESKQISGL